MFRSTVLIILVGSVYADIKTWNKNVNFYNQENWDLGRRPCPSDKIYIQEESTSIFLQTNGTLKELVLPMDGEIVLASDLKLAFSDDHLVDNDCPGQNISFVRNMTESWLDPNNWNNSEFIPIESDQVPCEYDDVLFPNNYLFYVGLEGNILVKTLSIDGRVLTSSLQASDYLRSSHGQKQFETSSATLGLSGLGCGESTGCKCGNNREEVLNKICSNVGDCPSIVCQDALKPNGSCCFMCGGFLTLYPDTQNFNFEQVRVKLVNDYRLDSSGSNMVRVERSLTVVNMYMSKPHEDRVQLVLTDNAKGIENGKEASRVTQQIYADMSRDPASFGVHSVDASFSGGSVAPVSRSAGGTAAGIIIALVIAVIIVVSIIFIMLKRQPFWFRKDEPLDADIEMPRMDKKHIHELPPSDLTAVEFDNPVYDKPIQNLYDDPTREANGNVEEIGSVDGGFHNPMAITSN